jgi:thiol-disulfide isomerase/thioredoxin
LNNLLTSIFLYILSQVVIAQNVQIGNFPALAGQEIKLIGIEGFDQFTIDSTIVSKEGFFELRYSNSEVGMGYLITANGKAHLVVLDHENIQLSGKDLSVPESVSIIEGVQNKQFVQYATEHPKREQALSAWIYLRKIYQRDSLFAYQKIPKAAIDAEIQRIKQEDEYFLKSLDPNTYVSWFLPICKLLNSVSTIAQYRTEEIPTTLATFRNLDYSDDRLYRSGLLSDVLESHFWLIENMGLSLDSVTVEMGVSIDILLSNLSQNEKRFNEITQYLFDLLEKRSLFQASEYLALHVLTQNSCTVNDDLARQLESYRAMKKGNTAPDIVFAGDVYKNGALVKKPKRLSDIQSNYKVLIFGAAWCPKCAEELAQLPTLYQKWQSHGVEVVFISLDTDKALFKSFTSIFPFISMCDFQKWEGKAVNDYYIFATPTILLLNKELKIVLRPNSVRQMDAWVDWYLVNKRK